MVAKAKAKKRRAYKSSPFGRLDAEQGKKMRREEQRERARHKKGMKGVTAFTSKK